MKIKGTIRVIQKRESGTSAATGKAWTSQRIIIGWDEAVGPDDHTREQLLLVKIREADLAKFDAMGFAVGDVIEGDVSFYTSLRNGYIHNDIVMLL